MRALRSLISTIGLTSAVIVACTTATDPTPVASITLSPPVDSVEVGQTQNRWSVDVFDAAGQRLTGRQLTWESNNPAVATVDATGAVTGVAAGFDALITVRAEGKEAKSTIKVLVPIVSIVTTADSFDLALTTTRQIAVQLVGPNGDPITNRLITWSSANPSVAVVSASGLVTPVSVGTATITISAGGKQKAVRVRVVSEPVTTVRITPQQTVHVVRLGQTYQLGAQCLNAALQVLAGRTITWNSGNPLVATVNGSGLVSGVGVGNASITATCDNSVNATVTAQVTLVPVSSVSISPPDGLSLAFGALGQLTATARDSANNILSLQGRSITWNSSNIPVATVSSQGVVQASNNNAGSTQITVSVDNVLSAPVTIDVHAFLLAFSSTRTMTLGEWLRIDD